VKPADDTIERTAAAWFGRRDGGLTAAETEKLAAWIEADPRHAAAFTALEIASRSLDRLASFRPDTFSRPDPDLPLVPRRLAARSDIRRNRHWLPWGAAAAAALIFAFVIQTSSNDPSNPAHEQVSTTIGGFHKRSLSDGSVLELNTDSRVEITYSRAYRRIKLLQGEVYVSVAKDASRPFIVTAGKVDVRAVGTAFNVRLRPETVDVLVTEGRIRLDESTRGHASPAPGTTEPESTQVAAGERAVIPSEVTADRSLAASIQVEPVDRGEMGRLLAWQDKRLEFGPTPLRDIVAEFNRYNRHQLVVANEETGALSVGGTFRANEPETLVHLLQSSFGIVSEKHGRQTVLRRLP
jgi:transmembrane sensor